MDVSYIKTLFQEPWDGYQLQCMNAGGNLPFYNFMKEYGHEKKDAVKKYETDAAKWYKKRLAA